jgi:thiol-disulfide isomerase/thioredoxin
LGNCCPGSYLAISTETILTIICLMKITTALFCLLTLIALNSRSEKTKTGESAAPAPGIWRGVISLPESELPFNFELQQEGKGTYTISLINAGERLALDSISVEGDSMYIPMGFFDAQIIAKVSEHGMEGYWIKNYAKDYRIPFKAEHGKNFRFENASQSGSANAGGKYAIRFADRPDSLISVGVFEQSGSKVTGTVLTRTGDYRYLEGAIYGNELKLSTFDGEHAYVLTGTVQGDSIVNGKFISGKAKARPWSAVKDANASLPDPSSLTFLKKGYDKVEFSFPGADGGTVSLQDPKYQGKVVILQLFGTWCPNCMDETKFLSPWYDKNKDKGVEIIGLAYEKKPELDYARSRVQKMKQRLNVHYDFAIAGTSDNEAAAKTLPMLNHVMSFPTTIFIDRQGIVRKIHTGFSGPGTGRYYEEFVEEFNQFMDKLISEESKLEVSRK